MNLYNELIDRVGNTPLIELKPNWLGNNEMKVKLEYFNPTGSIKDRAAKFIINKLLNSGEINSDTLLIESSSGNFGVALSFFSKINNLNFSCVIDQNINPINEFLIETMSSQVYKITIPDEHGGYLLNRIKKVNELCTSYPNSYWINQYANPYNAEAYYMTLGQELCDELEEIDYLFVGVSSGGTITGLSQRIKEDNPNCKIIAVDVKGSVIFGDKPKKRLIPGIGSSMVPEILNQAIIDDYVHVDELAVIDSCHELLKNHMVYAGGSSGAVFAAVKVYLERISKPGMNAKIVTIFPDRGDRYSSTIYNNKWISKYKSQLVSEFR
ncbi:2,3-diaminopropionate biosynthesis protein SbnA [Bacillus alkalicellulosilyticus]|uniref:2,3-diaminopropionate biosynthesis protein SbnA n=1 Tax=Alkalihalobacterium alkalicellulosilyticum TaxID=1912214 RepID=UPI0009965CD2|nr:2,3-diaminopropionate biosynthesis protein SbnA [Bacillus alkalicellulosilyticus]